jgi:hypothetical protein
MTASPEMAELWQALDSIGQDDLWLVKAALGSARNQFVENKRPAVAGIFNVLAGIVADVDNARRFNE